jgi:peroxiredoxin
MRKKLLLIIISCVIVIIGWLGYSTYKRIKIKESAGAKMSDLPDFHFPTLTNSSISKKDLPRNTPILVIYFNPDCEHCQYEAIELRKNIGLFKDVKILMISPATKKEIITFFEEYHLKDYPQVVPLMDINSNFFNVFGMVMTPLIIIYDKDQHLVKYFKGEARIENVAKLLHK